MRIDLLGVTILLITVANKITSTISTRHVSTGNPAQLEARGAVFFITKFTPQQGLGPLFNRTSCVGCHIAPTVGGMGLDGLGTATRFGRLTATGVSPLGVPGAPIARTHSVAEEGFECDLEPGIPANANVTSVRNAPDLHGTGLINAIPDKVIVAGAVPRGDGVQGRAHWVQTPDGGQGVGRFGWKADTISLRQFVADAFRNELGITSPLAPIDLAPAGQTSQCYCPGEQGPIEDDGSMVDAVTAFVAALPPPRTRARSLHGATVFTVIRCDSCHTPSLSLGERRVRLYSDLLLHDLGPDLDDKLIQGLANGRDWRTTPLWGLGKRRRFLHDGRARTISEAILAHGGEAAPAKQRFRMLSPEERASLLEFLADL